MVKKTKTIKEYESMTLAELRSEAQDLKLGNFMELPKRELIIEILKKATNDEGFVFVEGILEVMKDGSHGILRTEDLLPSDNDVYVSGSQIQKFSLRTGDEVAGPARLPKDKEKYLSLLRVDTVYGKPAADAAKRPNFRKLTPIFPNKQIKLETKQDVTSTRMIDLIAPIGFGQRSMVVSPPKAGKTWLLKDIANGISYKLSKSKINGCTCW